MPESSMPIHKVIADAAATSLDRSEGSATSSLYRAAIGSVNAGYYLPILERFESAGRTGPSWNWAAGLYTLNWMAFRKMWGAALVYLGAWGVAAFLMFGLGRGVFQFSEATQRDLWFALGFLSLVIPGFYGNAWFYAACRKEMARALSANTTLPEACAMLNQRASSRRNFVVLALVNLAVLGGAAGVYVSSPQANPPPAIVNSGVASNLTVGRAINLPASEAAPPKLEPVPESAPPPAPVPTPAPQPESISVSESAVAVPAPAAAVKAPVAGQRFHINVGVFASEINARNAHAKLTHAGLAAYTQDVESKQGKRTRVRVGPFTTRVDAEAAAEKIHTLKLDAVVVEP